jgi:hypothetical protein
VQHVTWRWLPWDQTAALDNARSATAALLQARIERDEIDAYIEAVLEHRQQRTQPVERAVV